MYKPPINSNRVKSIKSKFENIENGSPVKNNVIKNGYRNNLNTSSSTKKIELLVSDTSRNEKATLQRQASDPCKRNIKRTPAFRVDKSIERTSEFQRNSYNRSTLFESKVKQFSAVKNNCDNNSNVLVSEKSENINHVPNKPILVKSKSSLDFEYIRSKFDKAIPYNTNTNNENQSICNDNLNGVDLSLLYTEPIPKSLRNKTTTNQSENHEEIEEKPKINDIYSTSTLKLSDKVSCDELTDTLKSALKKPLPTGPAPKKPPRTFEHTLLAEQPERNISFLHVAKAMEKKLNIKPKITSKKTDPKYMLSKLENALRNNKLRARRQARTEISTSGEDSDDSLLFRSKTNEKPNRTLPRLPRQQDNCTSSPFNLNCLNGLSCSIANYEKIKEPNSSFFVSSNEEPIYAEPYHFVKESLDLALRNTEGSTRSRSTTKSARNSLYYMSTPVLSEGSKYTTDMNGFTISQDEAKLPDLKISESFHRQPSAENSSLSSFTSDLDSTPSPMEENCKLQSINQCSETKLSMDNSSHIDSTNRVENLKNCLRKTLDRSFTLDSAIRDSDSENNDENRVSDILKKFETYRQCMPKYCKPKIHKDSLFYCCLIIEKFRDVAQIKFQYPSCVDIPQNLESLCFPENNNTPQESTDATQNYSLLITNDKGERMFGYCRRVLPEGSTCCLPLAYCILSKYRAPRFYKKILVELESRHGMQDRYRDELISQFYNQKFPKPGDSIKINLANIESKSCKTDNNENFSELYNNVHINRSRECHETYKGNNEELEQILNNDNIRSTCRLANNVAEKDKTDLILTLHPDSRYEDADLKRLHQLPADVLLKIFSSLLLERKVILISSSIGKLSSCVDSLQSILYPFIWHHTFIPILPQQLWDIVESPTPVICGVLSNEVVEYHQIENGIVVDLDCGMVIVEEGDENKILSGSMQKVWRRSIALANKAAASMDYVHSVYLSDAYLQVFIMCFKDYKKYFVDGVFQKEEFLKNAKTKGIRRFLKMFTETYMFLAFLDTVLMNPENLIEFDKKIEMYGSEDSNVILDKLLEWHR